jgi:hypothetical protein
MNWLQKYRACFKYIGYNLNIRIIFEDSIRHLLHGASVAPTSDIRVSAMLSLVNVENWYVLYWGDFQWHEVCIRFSENR